VPCTISMGGDADEAYVTGSAAAICDAPQGRHTVRNSIDGRIMLASK